MSSLGRPLRILLVSEPGWAGVFRHVEGLADFLHQKNQKVALAYSDVRGSDGLQSLVERIQQRGGPVRNLRVSHAPQPGDLRAWARLRSLRREFRPDVIHAHSSKAGALVRLPAWFHRSAIPLFYTPNAYYGMGHRGGLAEWMFTAVERWLANVGTTINISEDEANFACHRLHLKPEHQRIIHNPVQTEYFRPARAGEKPAARLLLGIPADTLLLGTAGRLCFEKDPETLYRAIQPLMARHPRLRLLHMIAGASDPALETLAKTLGIHSRIHLLPYREDLRPAYHALDGFVMTSRYEAGWPIVILEALACNLPIVSGTGPGSSDIGRAGLSHCWTAAVGDAGGFTRAMDSLLQDGTNPRPCNHREIALERFSPEKCYGAVLSAYRQQEVRSPQA